MLREIPYPAFCAPSCYDTLGLTGISTFSILLMIAFLTGSFLLPRELERRGLRPEVADCLFLLRVVGAIVGSKVFYVFDVWGRIWVDHEGFGENLKYIFLNWKGMGVKYPTQAATHEIIGMWESLFSPGGLVFYGGFACVFTFIYIYLRREKVEVWRYIDAGGPTLAIGYAIGRLGCMVSGDGCFGHGASADIPILTMVYGPGAFLSSAGVRVWNTPVMESIASMGLFAFYMLWMRYQRFKPGMIVATFLIFNGVVRFLIEFLRLNDAVIDILDPPTVMINGQAMLLSTATSRVLHGSSAYYFENWHWYGLTQGQIIALFIIPLGIAWILIQKLYQREGEPEKRGGAQNGSKSKEQKKAAKDTDGEGSTQVEKDKKRKRKNRKK